MATSAFPPSFRLPAYAPHFPAMIARMDLLQKQRMILQSKQKQIQSVSRRTPTT
jgi:hypothetical protein